MKKVRIEAFCDNSLVHAEDDDAPAVVERTLTLDRSGPRVVDVCEVCDKSLDLIRVLIERGAPPEQPEPSAAPKRRAGRRPLPLDCREPGCIDARTGQTYVAPNRAALGAHLKDNHDRRLSDYDWNAPPGPQAHGDSGP